MVSPITKIKNNQFIQSVLDNRLSLDIARTKHRYIVLTLEPGGKVSKVNSFRFEFLAKIAAKWRNTFRSGSGPSASFAGREAIDILSIKAKIIVPYVIKEIETITDNIKLSYKGQKVDNTWIYDDANTINTLQNNYQALAGNIIALRRLGLFEDKPSNEINKSLSAIEQKISSLRATSSELIKIHNFFSTPLPQEVDIEEQKDQYAVCRIASQLLDKSGNIIDQETINSVRKHIRDRMVDLLERSKEKLQSEKTKLKEELAAKKSDKTKMLEKLAQASRSVETQIEERLSLDEIAKKRHNEKHISPLFTLVSKVGGYLDEEDISAKLIKGKDILKIAAAERLPIDAEVLQHTDAAQKVLNEALDAASRRSENKLKEVRERSPQAQVMKFLKLDPEIAPEDLIASGSQDLQHRETEMHLEINSWFKGLGFGLQRIEQDLIARGKVLTKALEKNKEQDKDLMSREIRKNKKLLATVKKRRMSLESQLNPKAPKEKMSDQVKILKDTWNFLVNNGGRKEDGSLNIEYFKHLVPKLSSKARSEMFKYIKEGEGVDEAGMHRLVDLSLEIDELKNNHQYHEEVKWQLELYSGLAKQTKHSLVQQQMRLKEDIGIAKKQDDPGTIQRHQLSLGIVKILLDAIENAPKSDQIIREESLLMAQLSFAKKVLAGYTAESFHTKDQLTFEKEVVRLDEEVTRLNDGVRKMSEKNQRIEEAINDFKESHFLASQSRAIADSQGLLAA